MSDDDRQEREEQATRELLDGYCRLLTLMAHHVADGTKAEDVTSVVDGMPAGMARAMLLARLAADAVHAAEVAERLRGWTGGDPTMN